MRKIGLLAAGLAVWAAWLGATLTAGASSPDGCAPPGSRPVTLITRPGPGHPFRSLSPSGEAYPFIDPAASRTVVPVRAFFRAISLTEASIRWDGRTRTARLSRGSVEIAFTFAPGEHTSRSARVNGQERPVDSFLCNGKLYAPARFLAETLGMGIKWYKDHTVVVDPAWPYTPEDINPLADDTALGQGLVTSEGARHSEGGLETGAFLGNGADDAAVRVCGGWEGDLLDAVLSPVAATRRAARGVACQFMRAW